MSTGQWGYDRTWLDVTAIWGGYLDTDFGWVNCGRWQDDVLGVGVWGLWWNPRNTDEMVIECAGTHFFGTHFLAPIFWQFSTHEECGPIIIGMQVQLTNPELEAKVDQWVTDTGRTAQELVEDLIVTYFDELAEARETLDSRYDEIKNGKVELIDGEEAFARLRAKSVEWRKSHA